MSYLTPTRDEVISKLKNIPENTIFMVNNDKMFIPQVFNLNDVTWDTAVFHAYVYVYDKETKALKLVVLSYGTTIDVLPIKQVVISKLTDIAQLHKVMEKAKAVKIILDENSFDSVVSNMKLMCSTNNQCYDNILNIVINTEIRKLNPVPPEEVIWLHDYCINIGMPPNIEVKRHAKISKEILEIMSWVNALVEYIKIDKAAKSAINKTEEVKKNDTINDTTDTEIKVLRVADTPDPTLPVSPIKKKAAVKRKAPAKKKHTRK